LPVRVIPGYPDPASGRIYNLQAGTYANAETAVGVVRLIMSQGFNTVQEASGPYYRVIVPGVPAAMVYAVIQRLAALGIPEIIIQ
jgi:rare lipoprotein A